MQEITDKESVFEPLFKCPVCGFDGLMEPPYNDHGNGSHEICPCCGFEYGFDDQSEGVTHEEYLAKWLQNGAQWFDPDQKPAGWDLQTQLNTLPGK
jgi:transcription elongation factor Elf1